MDQKRGIPSNLLAVRRPVSDVLLLLLHAVLDCDATRCSQATGADAWSGSGAQPGTAVWDQVMGPRVGASSVLGGVPAGAKLFLRGGAVLWRKTPPPAAAGHWEGHSLHISMCTFNETHLEKAETLEVKLLILDTEAVKSTLR